MPRLSRLALPAVAGTLGVVLLLGLAVPIYADEVLWRAQTARAPWDGGVDRGLADQCGPNTTAVPPLFLRPVRHLSAWGQAALADPRAVRVGGVVLALVGVALLAALARVAGAGRAGPTAAFALLGLGTLPWLLVWSRPEQAILLALLLAMVLALGPGRPGWRLGAIVVLAVATLGYHPKAVLFAPVCAVAAWAVPGRRAWRGAAAALILVLAGAAGLYWRARLACPADPLIRARQAAESALAGGGLAGLLGNASPMGYVGGAAVRSRVMSDWLPPRALPAALEIGWFTGVALAWQAAFLALAAGLAVAGRSAWTRRGDWRAPALAAAAAACILGWGATQPNKNAYEAALVLPLAAAALLLVWAPFAARWPRLADQGVRVAVVLALVSQALLVATYAVPMARAAAQPGTLYRQTASFTPWGWPGLRAQVLAAGRLCGIRPEAARYLLVDELTYWPYLRSWRPLFRGAVIGDWAGTIRDPLAFLAAHRSSGVVVQCAGLPAAWRARARAAGEFCCLGAPA